MAKRLTDTEKYEDAWFIELNKEEKLFFYYLIDRVDHAGFYEISFKRIQFDLDLNKDEILGAIKGLARGLLGADSEIKKGSKIYLKNFLEHQKMNPLNPFNSFHKHALGIFLDNFEFVKKSPFLKNLKVCGFNKKLNEKIDENLFNYISKNQGLASPLVEVEVEVEVEDNFEKSEKLLTAYEFLKNKSPGEIEAFEIQNKKSFPDYEKFVEYFNAKAESKEFEFKPKVLFGELKKLNLGWDKSSKKSNIKSGETITDRLRKKAQQNE